MRNIIGNQGQGQAACEIRIAAENHSALRRKAVDDMRDQRAPGQRPVRLVPADSHALTSGKNNDGQRGQCHDRTLNETRQHSLCESVNDGDKCP